VSQTDVESGVQGGLFAAAYALRAANGYSVALIREERVGYIVYQDDVQVIAEPFADTRTGP
jgi:hypothetical protein